MAIPDYVNKNVINIDNIENAATNIDSTSEKVKENLRKGNLIGASLSLILKTIDRFNMFNKSNEFEIRMNKPEVRFYKRETPAYTNDLRFISGFSEKTESTKFVQLLLPHKSIYIILDHILGGEGNGEYERTLSTTDLALLRWYFNFYAYFKNDEDDKDYNYQVFGDFRKQQSFPIKPLFKGLNLLIAYIPITINNTIFSEALIRINYDILKKMVEMKYDKKVEHQQNEKKETSKLFSINRMATDDELDDIVEQIIRQ